MTAGWWDVPVVLSDLAKVWIPNVTLPNTFLQVVEGLWRSFPLLVLGILDSSCQLIILSYAIHKDNKTKSWTDPTFSFPWRRTYPMAMGDKARNVRVIFLQLPTKAGYETPLTLHSLSWSIARTPNYINSRLDLLSLPSLVFNQKCTISEWKI